MYFGSKARVHIVSHRFKVMDSAIVETRECDSPLNFAASDGHHTTALSLAQDLGASANAEWQNSAT